MELAMFDALIEQCRDRGIRKIVGVYIPSKKNNMVSGHYLKLGFTAGEGNSECHQSWHYDLSQAQPAKARYICRTVNSTGAIADGALAKAVRSHSEVLEVMVSDV
jgi:predicted enzyme involved in methoxymalonyl-ACP biosynthesis